jgi:hypothetical protein
MDNASERRLIIFSPVDHGMPASYLSPPQFVVPGVKDIYASMHKVDTIDRLMILVYDRQENLKNRERCKISTPK